MKQISKKQKGSFANPTESSTHHRRYDLDWLRVLAFLILIFYHIGMLYVANWQFHIKSDYQADWLKFPMVFVNQWRMPLLFLISGIASSLLLRKIGPKNFLKKRSFKLGIPFLAGVILIVPPQPYIQAITNGTISQNFGEMTYLQFLWHYFTFQGWPKDAFDGSQSGFAFNHLWFIPYLFLYTFALLPLQKILRSTHIEKRFNKIGPSGLIIFPLLILISWQWFFDQRQSNHSLINDGYGHAFYFSIFIFGYLISDKTELWHSIFRLRWAALFSAVCSYCLLITLWWGIPNYEWKTSIEGLVIALNLWLWLLAVLGWAMIYLNKPHECLAYANKRIYPWYIFHQTLTILAGYFLGKLALGGFVEPFLVILITIGGCLLLTELLIRHSHILRVMFGMNRG